LLNNIDLRFDRKNSHNRRQIERSGKSSTIFSKSVRAGISLTWLIRKLRGSLGCAVGVHLARF